jgi:hypothetical protein
MRVFLLHRDRDFDVKPELHDAIFEAMTSGDLFGIANVRRDLEKAYRQSGLSWSPKLPETDEALAQDLELGTLWNAMARGDELLFEVARRALLSSLEDPDAIVYRQQVLADCIEHPETAWELYALTIEALQNERRVGTFWSEAGPSVILHRSVQVLTLHLDVLRRLRQIASEQAETFRSDGFGRFFAMLKDELADEYLASVERHLHELEFKRGVLESAALGKGNKGRGYTVRRPRELRWSERLSRGRRSSSYSFTIPARDENGAKALEQIRGRGINHVANAVAQAADHVKSFFGMLRVELAFYLGCLNLLALLAEKGGPSCFPTPLAPDRQELSARGLYDVCLTFHLQGRVVGNDLDAEDKSLVVITGANQGGKSVFLRSVGLAQLMMQAGMFVGAESFAADVASGVFTHYKREEEDAMEGGKLDEELARMSEIADAIRPRGLLLCNESFASTNEREGSEIARQVVGALVEKGIKVVFVTHMFDLAESFRRQASDNMLFLKAERKADGRRTFRMVEGAPLPTSHGEDSYRRIFGDALDTEKAAASR